MSEITEYRVDAFPEGDPFENSPMYRAWLASEEKLETEHIKGNAGIPVRDILNSPGLIARRSHGTPDEVLDDYTAYMQQLYLEMVTGYAEPRVRQQALRELGFSDTEQLKRHPIYNKELFDTYENVINKYDVYEYPYEVREAKEPSYFSTVPIGAPAGMGAVIPSLSVEEQKEIQNRKQRVAKAGGNPNTYYQEGQGFLERWGIDKRSRFPLELSIDSDPNVQRFVAPINLTPDDVETIYRRKEPELQARWADPRDASLGLLVKSASTQDEWVPFEPLEGTNSSLAPIVDDVLIALGQESLPIALEGVTVMGLGRRLAKRAQKRIEEYADKGEEGVIELKRRTGGTPSWLARKTGEITAYTALAGTSAAIGRMSMLLYGKEAGILPDLSFERIIDDTEYAMIMGAAGAGMGEILFRAATKMYEAATGQIVTPQTLNNIRVRAAQWRKKFKPQEMDENALSEDVEVMGERGAALAKRLNESRSWVSMTPDDTLQQIEQELLRNLPHTTSIRARSEQNRLEQSKVLKEFYENFKQNAGDGGRAKLPTYRELVDRVTQLRDEGLAAEKAAIEAAEQSAVEGTAAKLGVHATGEELQDAQLLGAIDKAEEVKPALEEVQRRITTSDIFPETRGELLILNDETMKTAQGRVDEVLNRPEYQALTTSELKGGLAKYVKEPLERMLTAGDGPTQMLRTLESVQASNELRDMLPMFRDEDGNLRSMIKELLGALNRSEETGRMLARYPFTFPQVQQAREAIRMVYGNHPDRTVRKEAEALLEGFDEALSAMLDVGYKKQRSAETGVPVEDIALPTNTAQRREAFGQDFINAKAELLETRLKLDGPLMLQILNASDEREAARVLMGMSANRLRPLVSKLELSTENLPKLTALREIFEAEMTRRVIDKDPAKQARQYKAFIKKYGDQIDAIFGEGKLTEFLTFAKMQEQMVREIALGRSRALEIEKILGSDASGEVPRLISQFLEPGAGVKRGIEESPAYVKLEELSKLAEKFPQVREGMQELFWEWMGEAVEGRDFNLERAMQVESGFSLEKLNQLADLPYKAGPEGTQKFARQLSLILGEKEGQRTARMLRRLVKDLRPLRDVQWLKIAESLQRGDAVDMIDGVNVALQRGQRATMSPLSPTSRRTTLFRELVRDRLRQKLLDILQSPDALERFLEYRNKKVTAKNILQVLGQISLERSQDIGGGQTREEEWRETYRQMGDLESLPSRTRGFERGVEDITDRIDELSGGAF